MTTGTGDLAQTLISRWSRPARLVGVAFLALILLIPLQMVRSVIQERYQTYSGVVREIAGSWSGDQRVAGPILIVPYTEKVAVRDQFITPQGEKKVGERWETYERRAIILPELLSYDGSLAPEIRRRGIYRVQVYSADLEISAAFRDLQATIETLSSKERLEDIRWSEAVVGFGLSDPRGIVEVEGFEINGHSVQVRPGTTLSDVFPRGFHAPVGDVASDSLDVRLPINIRGSGGFRFLPLGATTRASIRSDWPHPSFVGDVLPAVREISDDGFSAEWTIPLLNRSYPQAWSNCMAVGIDEIEAGVRLFEPVALYDLVTRAVKYGLLFITLTFLTLGLIEFVMDTRLSLVQYLLIGVALALFFLLLIALAEHMGFATAYLLASATVVVINTLYCAAILPRRSLAAAVGGVLTAIYGILYTILRAEDYALLGGTLLLVVALTITMYFTRRIHNPRGA
ncbi:MAG: cell envelope integrity protein CreD [Thermoanaerobaculales bacterium]|nr:cell envelope integrity protein CreD [Thermoanaerobaculales bacterium]